MFPAPFRSATAALPEVNVWIEWLTEGWYALLLVLSGVRPFAALRYFFPSLASLGRYAR